MKIPVERFVIKIHTLTRCNVQSRYLTFFPPNVGGCTTFSLDLIISNEPATATLVPSPVEYYELILFCYQFEWRKIAMQKSTGK